MSEHPSLAEMRERYGDDLRGIGLHPDLCWFHGEEPVPDDAYRVCGECGHAWAREALIAADAEKFNGSPRNPETIYACPLCVHDF